MSRISSETSSTTGTETEATLKAYQDNTKYIDQIYRKLDTVARYLTGQAICAAIVFNKKNSTDHDEDKYIITSTNKMSKADVAFLKSKNIKEQEVIEDDDSNPNALAFMDIIYKLVKFAQLGKEPEAMSKKQVLYKEFHIIFASQYSREMLKYDLKIINDSKTLSSKDKLMFALLSEDKKNYFEFAKHVTKEHIRLEGLQDQAELSFLKELIPKAKEVYERVVHDVRKLVRFLDDKEDKFVQAISVGKFVFAEPDQDKYINPETGKSQLSHAEMNVLKYIIDHQLAGKHYMGISKLSCFDCANDLVHINLLGGKVEIYVRGEHGVIYSDERLVMHFKEDWITADIEGRKVSDSDASESVDHAASKKGFFLCANLERYASYMKKIATPRETIDFLQSMMSDNEYEDKYKAYETAEEMMAEVESALDADGRHCVSGNAESQDLSVTLTGASQAAGAASE